MDRRGGEINVMNKRVREVEGSRKCSKMRRKWKPVGKIIEHERQKEKRMNERKGREKLKIGARIDKDGK